MVKYRKMMRAVLAGLLVLGLTVSCGSRADDYGLLEDELTSASTASLSIKVSGSSSGRSMRFIGANGGGSALPKMSDIRDAGLTTYRLFGGMQSFEPVDDDGKFGTSTISDMKRILASSPSRVNDFVNWSAFDRGMKSQGEILKGLYTVPGMQPVLILRNSANWGDFWVPRMNVTGSSCKTSDGKSITWPQFTQADWNEWWQHVFAVVYWVNVRNGSTMRVDRWSVHNEPNEQPSQGWCGTREQYLEFMKYTHDAIDFVYKTYLKDRPRFIHGGALSMRSGWQDWFRPMFRNGSGSSFGDRNFYQPSMFNVIDMHPYNADIGRNVATARSLTRESGAASYVRNYPIWASEMGSYKSGQWDSLLLVIDNLVNNLISGSTPGDTQLEGAALWRMYDGSSDTQGLIKRDGTRRAGFYAMRLSTMALSGAKPVFPTQLSSTSNVRAITTREASGEYNLLLTNRSSTTAHDVRADVSALLSSGRADLYLLSGSRKGASSLERMSSLTISSGQLRFNLPPHAVVLVRFRS